MAALTIRKHTGLPVLQDLVKLLSKLLVAWVAKQVILAASGVEMLQTNTDLNFKKVKQTQPAVIGFPAIRL